MKLEEARNVDNIQAPIRHVIFFCGFQVYCLYNIHHTNRRISGCGKSSSATLPSTPLESLASPGLKLATPQNFGSSPQSSNYASHRLGAAFPQIGELCSASRPLQRAHHHVQSSRSRFTRKSSSLTSQIAVKKDLRLNFNIHRFAAKLLNT